MAGKVKDAVFVQVELGYPNEVTGMVAALRRAARNETDPEIKNRFRRWAQRINSEFGRPKLYHQRVVRPTHDDQQALERVVQGLPPYPVLSTNDARRAFLRMRGVVTLKEMARRLHVNERTIARWPKYHEEGRWDL